MTLNSVSSSYFGASLLLLLLFFPNELPPTRVQPPTFACHVLSTISPHRLSSFVFWARVHELASWSRNSRTNLNLMHSGYKITPNPHSFLVQLRYILYVSPRMKNDEDLIDGDSFLYFICPSSYYTWI
ncbi:hypothetical protein C8R42DRAFT_664281 [Lentinula raphanica]|nr:hypothetical protein C8R42DRAFT_664281 [Lentinula raphanica]